VENLSSPKKKQRYHKEKKAAYYQANKARILAMTKAKYAANPEMYKVRVRARRLRNIYFPHLTPSEALAEYQRLHDLQKGKCAICKNPETKIDPQLGRPCVLAVDHCHTTNKVRGLLCFRCNTNLGWYESMKDNFTAYLEASNG